MVEADKGEGGFTYTVCFESKQAKGQRARVEVRDEEGVPSFLTVPLDDDPLLSMSSCHFAVTPSTDRLRGATVSPC